MARVDARTFRQSTVSVVAAILVGVLGPEMVESSTDTSTRTTTVTHAAGQVSDSVATVSAGVEEVTASIGEISGNAATTATIASAVEEQTATTSEIGRHLGQVAISSQEISGNTGQAQQSAERARVAAATTRTACDDLTVLAVQLHDLVGGYRLRPTAHAQRLPH